MPCSSIHNLAKPDLGCGEQEASSEPSKAATSSSCLLSESTVCHDLESAENFRSSWQSQLILLSLITTSSRAQQTFSVGARWSFQFVGYPDSVTSIQPAIVVLKQARPIRKGMGVTVCH